MAPSSQEARAAFMRTFKETAPHQHRYEVWRDFTVMAACALHNGLMKDQVREAEYLEIIHRYDKGDQEWFPVLLGQLITILDEEPADVLGSLYMELEIGSKERGQFFTPVPVSEVMAEMMFGDMLAKLERQDFITVHEPACGAGGMILAAAKTLITAGHNPAETMFVSCVDVDRVAALMCYIQLSLWNIPAEVIVGNTLSMEMREVWYTPAFHLGLWSSRLANKPGGQVTQEAAENDSPYDGPPEQLSLF